MDLDCLSLDSFNYSIKEVSPCKVFLLVSQSASPNDTTTSLCLYQYYKYLSTFSNDSMVSVIFLQNYSSMSSMVPRIDFILAPTKQEISKTTTFLILNTTFLFVYSGIHSELPKAS